MHIKLEQAERTYELAKTECTYELARTECTYELGKTVSMSSWMQSDSTEVSTRWEWKKARDIILECTTDSVSGGQTALYQYTSWYFQAESGREIEMENAWSITNSFPSYTFYQECIIKYALDSSSWALPWLTAALPGIVCMPLELILPSFSVCRCLLGTVCLTWITLYFTSYWTASPWVGELTDRLLTDSLVPRPIFLPPAWPGNEVNV